MTDSKLKNMMTQKLKQIFPTLKFSYSQNFDFISAALLHPKYCIERVWRPAPPSNVNSKNFPARGKLARWATDGAAGSVRPPRLAATINAPAKRKCHFYKNFILSHIIKVFVFKCRNVSTGISEFLQIPCIWIYFVK